MKYFSIIVKSNLVFLTCCSFITIAVYQLISLTRWGAGLSSDSINYILSARSMLESGNLDKLSSHWPPLYPLLLAVVSFFCNIDMLSTARWTQIFLYVCNIMLFIFVIYKSTDKSLFSFITACLIIVSSQIFLEIHSMAWSEPLYILLSLSGITFLSIHINKCDGSRYLILSGVFVGLSIVTRYAGLSLLVSSALCILFFSKQNNYSRILDVLKFSLIATFPFLIWIARNISTGRSVTNREVSFLMFSFSEINQAIQIISDWFFVPLENYSLSGIFLFIVFFVMWFFSTKIKYYNNFPEILFVNIFSYIIFIAISKIIFDAAMPFDRRILAPLYVLLFLAIITTSYRYVSRKNRYMNIGVLLLLTLCIISFFQIKVYQKYVHFASNGLDFAHKTWVESDIIRWVKSEKNKSIIYTNGPEPLQIYTSVESKMIPRHTDTGTRKRNEKIVQEINQMVSELIENNGYIIYFSTINWRWYLPTEKMLSDVLPLELVYKGNDGNVYKIKGQ